MIFKECEKEIGLHDILLTGPSFKMGKIHWHTQKAYQELKNQFGLVVEDTINWWISNGETDIGDLREKTEETLVHVQKLKENSTLFKEERHKEDCRPKSYSNLIDDIKNFTNIHVNEINALYKYVDWLHQKDVLAPNMLFSYSVWGSTRSKDREIIIESDRIDYNIIIKTCAEHALGLRLRYRYILQNVYSEICSEISDSYPEDCHRIPFPKDEHILRTSIKIIDEFAIYFENIRQSLRNIIIDIDEYMKQTSFLYDNSFWEKFIKKAMGIKRVENQLWDFKKTFQMWETSNNKERSSVDFCENIAAYANTSGGVLIVGITDSEPREIAELDGLEDKIKHAKDIIKKYINYSENFTHFQQILIDIEGVSKSCLIIVISQTKSVVSVEKIDQSYSYPIRLETGLGYSNHSLIESTKSDIYRNNYDFILKINKFIQ